MYFLVTTDEDGDVSLETVNKEELLRRLTPDADGYAELPAKSVRFEPSTGDCGHDLQAKSGTFIIKGELVTPKPVEVVTAFEIS